MSNRIVTDSEALSATRAAILKFADSMDSVRGEFSQYFSQANMQIDQFVVRLKERIDELYQQKASLEKDIASLNEEKNEAMRRQTENDEERSDSVIYFEKQIETLDYKKEETTALIKKLSEYEEDVSNKYITFQDQQSFVMNLIDFNDDVDSETVVSFIDKAITKLENYRAVGLDVDFEVNNERGRAKVLRR